MLSESDQRIIPTNIQFRADKVVGYHRISHKSTHKAFLKESISKRKVRQMAYSGCLSKGAKSRLRKCAELISCITPQRRMYHPVNDCMFNFRLAFITLTFPSPLDLEQEIELNKLFVKPIIQVLVRRFGVKNYVWKAELTGKGRVHLHLLVDSTIHYEHLRNSWNRL